MTSGNNKGKHITGTIILLTVLAIFIVIGGIGFNWVNTQPWFCNSCHEMNFQYESWGASSHKGKAVCTDCHMEPGLRGYIEEKVRGSEQLVSHFSGNYKLPIRAIVRVKNDQCLACHPETPTLPDKNIEVQHATHMEKNVLCADCHSRVVHNMTGQPNVIQRSQCDSCHKAHINFTLTGKHASLDCKECHRGGNYKSVNRMCETCHEVPAKHSPGMNSRCDLCHSSTGWKPPKSSHERFPLSGRHLSVSCDKCHINERYQGTVPLCESCHNLSENHIPGIKGGCESCHLPTGWKPANFDHSKFPLVGIHTSLSCDKCHINGIYKGTSHFCESCHNLPPNHIPGITGGCDLCHTPVGWKPANFDHGNFPLTGIHQTLTCDRCHKNGVYQGTPSACVDCHQAPASHQGMDTNCALCHNPSGFTPSTFVHNNVGEHMGRGAERPLPCVRCHPVVFTETSCTGSGCHSSNNPRGG